eukprot:scaffold33937_cov30-Tisochrysis_lutea.AAC.4
MQRAAGSAHSLFASSITSLSSASWPSAAGRLESRFALTSSTRRPVRTSTRSGSDWSEQLRRANTPVFSARSVRLASAEP